MDERKKQRVTQKIDRAIADVARDELKRLRRGRSDADVAARIKRALASLMRLSEGGKPHYDEWDALCYLVWYQPRQINLAYSLASRLLGKHEPQTKDGMLRLTDFACGASAMEIGLQLARVDLKERFNVKIDTRDESSAMKEIGERLLVRYPPPSVDRRSRYLSGGSDRSGETRGRRSVG